MESFLDIVNGCALVMKDFHLSITFPSRSDAMLASLILKHTQEPMHIFDDFFTLFRHKDFCSSDLKMSRTEDVMDFIAHQRQSNAIDRARKSTAVTSHNEQVGALARIPMLIVGLVAEHLDVERTPLHRILYDQRPSCEADDNLRTMCLVHRSWTEVAQRCFRRRVCLRGRFEIRALSLSPQLGPWVRDLSIATQAFVPSKATHFDVYHSDIPRVLCDILKKCPNTKNLHLQDILSPPMMGHGQWKPCSIIRTLGDLVFLENLWLGQVLGGSGIGIKEVFATISSLQHLKGLSLRDWYLSDHGVWVDEECDIMTSISPAPVLEFLSLVHISNSVLLAKLCRKCDSIALQRLELSFDDIRFSLPNGEVQWNGLPSFLDHIKPHTTMLLLEDCQPTDDIASVLVQFPSIRSLTLCFAQTISSVNLRSHILPRSIISVHIHFLRVPDELQDSLIVTWLQASPFVRKITVSYNSNANLPIWGDPNDLILVNNEQLFTSSEAHCKDNDVIFKFQETRFQPSALDI